MICDMIAYSLYTMLAVGLAVMVTAVFRRLRQDDWRIAPPEEDAAFDRRMEEIEVRYGLGRDQEDDWRRDARTDRE
jgi:hypothetical protein